MRTLANNKEKYGDPDFDNRQLETLFKYFKIEGYPNLLLFLKRLRDD
jgi:hypothetical protein